jgi:hypothetical protein
LLVRFPEKRDTDVRGFYLHCHGCEHAVFGNCNAIRPQKLAVQFLDKRDIDARFKNPKKIVSNALKESTKNSYQTRFKNLIRRKIVSNALHKSAEKPYQTRFINPPKNRIKRVS